MPFLAHDAVSLQRTVQPALLLKGLGQGNLQRRMLGLRLPVLPQLQHAAPGLHLDELHPPNNIWLERNISKRRHLCSGIALL